MTDTERSLNNAIAFIRILIENYKLPKGQCLQQMKTIFPRLSASYLEEYPDDRISMETQGVEEKLVPFHSIEPKALIPSPKPQKKSQKAAGVTPNIEGFKEDCLLKPFVEPTPVEEDVQLDIDSDPVQDIGRQEPPSDHQESDRSREMTEDKKQSPQKKKKKKTKQSANKNNVSGSEEPNKEVAADPNKPKSYLDQLTEDKGFCVAGISGLKPVQGFQIFGQKKKFRVFGKSKVGEGEFASLSTPMKVKGLKATGIIR